MSSERVVFVVAGENGGEQKLRTAPGVDVEVQVESGGCIEPVGVFDEGGRLVGELDAACEGDRMVWRGEDADGPA